ncbi:MAG: glycine oxidase ThiO [Pirellulaceae bacterium]|nr:glycine oxidase ThiO [Pirellulaceae bacterium]
MTAEHDCLILGGGVIGLSLAWDLACHGHRVRVIDQGPLGREASWAGAGMLPPAHRGGSAHPLAQLQALSCELHPQWAERLRAETGIDTGYRRCGAIYLARSTGEAASLAAHALQLGDEQIAVQQLTAQRLAELEPALAALCERGEIRAAIRLPEEAQLRNPRHLRALAEACRRRGVELLERCTAERLEVDGSRVRQAVTSRGPLTARTCCLASGAWTGRLLAQLGLPCGILPVRGQMIQLRCPAPPFRHILNEGPRYLVPRDDGVVLAGSTEEEVGFDKSTTAEAIADLRRLAGELVPALRELPVERSWAGLRPGSFDGFPYLGKVPGLDNAFVAAGHFRGGLNLSPATAVVMSRLIRGEPPGIDLAEFRVGRG